MVESGEVVDDKRRVQTGSTDEDHLVIALHGLLRRGYSGLTVELDLDRAARWPYTEGVSDYAELAALMRTALQRAQCDPSVPVELAVRHLEQAAEEIQRLYEGDVFDRLLLRGDVLVDVYGFASVVNKTVVSDHPARLPQHRRMDLASYLEYVRNQLPYLHERQQQLLEAIDDAYPPD